MNTRVLGRAAAVLVLLAAAGMLVFGLAAIAHASLAGQQPSAPQTPSPACSITAARSLGGGSADDWSRSSGLIASARLDGSGVYQLHTLRADGSDATCLTCQPAPDAPRTDRHKIHANWHPSGAYIVVQGEMDAHPLTRVHTLPLISELIANGLWSNLYVTTPDGGHWFRLTDYSSVEADGALAPFFSADGTRLVWSRLVQPASSESPFAMYRLMLADFVVDVDGAPTIQNTRDITPDGARFIEPRGFSPDGNNVLFATDLGLESVWSMDIWTMDMATGALTNLTRSPTTYEEHATFSLGGDRVVYMSSEPYPGTFLQTDLMVTNTDGSGKQQLTFFNEPGHAESTNRQAMPIWMSWNAEGSALAITLQLGGFSYPRREIWVVEFAGPCGI